MRYLMTALIFITLTACSTESAPLPDADVHFFYSNKCTDCILQDPFMKELNNMDRVTVYYYDVETSLAEWQTMAADYQVDTGSLPMTFVGDKVFGGFREKDGDLMTVPGTNVLVGYKNQILIAVQEELDR